MIVFCFVYFLSGGNDCVGFYKVISTHKLFMYVVPLFGYISDVLKKLYVQVTHMKMFTHVKTFMLSLPMVDFELSVELPV